MAARMGVGKNSSLKVSPNALPVTNCHLFPAHVLMAGLLRDKPPLDRFVGLRTWKCITEPLVTSGDMGAGGAMVTPEHPNHRMEQRVTEPLLSCSDMGPGGVIATPECLEHGM